MFEVAKNTFREIIRDRVLYGLIAFSILVLGLSLILGKLSFAEQKRISLNFGFSAIHLSVVILSTFVGATLVFKEIERQTILTLLVRPMTRSSFMIGRFIGMQMVILVLLLGFSFVLSVVLLSFNQSWTLALVVALYGVWLESLVILSLSLFFGSFMRPSMTVIATISLFFVGHWLESLNFFAQKSSHTLILAVNKVCQLFIPNLERFNWREFALETMTRSIGEVFSSTFYSLFWVVFLVSGACLIFQRREFV